MPHRYNAAGDSYYGVVLKQLDHDPSRIFVHLYFGGSPLNSAPGFYVIPV